MKSFFSDRKFRSILTWLDQNLLFSLCCFLMVFIPLWPKIPLFSPIEQYIVRVRLEDLFVLLTAGLWFVQFLRKKIQWRSPMFWLVMAYAILGLVSTLVAIFVIHTIPEQPLHMGKSFLHYFRYLEYFSLFFIAFSSVNSRLRMKIVMGLWAVTVLAISLYGYGQKYFYFPVYSTMNREFSKGIRLILTEHARVQSTFGGHYDMAAYLVIMLPILLSMAIFVHRKVYKISLYAIFWLGTWLLILSAARTPLGAYLVGVAIVFLVSVIFKKKFLSKIGFLASQGVLYAFILFLMFYYFGTDMIERMSHLVDSIPQVSQTLNQANDQRKKILSDGLVAKIFPAPEVLLASLPKGTPPENSISTDDIAAAAAATQDVASLSDLPPIPFNPQPSPSPSPKVQTVIIPGSDEVPSDVYVNVPAEVEEYSTVSAEGETIIVRRETQRVYSECALEKELSLCIRQEVLWPRAIEGFLTNPITGSGYATLTKESVGQFTEADSTDNNYLRTLGETGILGFIIFYGAVVLVIYYSVKNIKPYQEPETILSIGILGGTIGLLVNAAYIDVFAASKVAFCYWGVSGAFLGYLFSQRKIKK